MGRLPGPICSTLLASSDNLEIAIVMFGHEVRRLARGEQTSAAQFWSASQKMTQEASLTQLQPICRTGHLKGSERMPLVVR